MKYPKIAGFVGFEGDSVWLATGLPDDHPVVRAYPHLFTSTPPAGIEPEPPRRGRPLGSKNRPKVTPQLTAPHKPRVAPQPTAPPADEDPDG
jgi:hypothetical protein